MPEKEKGRLAEGSPIPDFVLGDSSEHTVLRLHQQVLMLAVAALA
jgi:hypothetical protein